jgi:hypothetical protein
MQNRWQNPSSPNEKQVEQDNHKTCNKMYQNRWQSPSSPVEKQLEQDNHKTGIKPNK